MLVESQYWLELQSEWALHPALSSPSSLPPLGVVLPPLGVVKAAWQLAGHVPGPVMASSCCVHPGQLKQVLAESQY